MIHLELREKTFAGAADPILRDVHIELAPGELVALLGPSGAGKTTLLRVIAGLDKQFVGTLQCESSKPRIAFLFQEPRLMPWLTALENVVLVAKRGRAAARDALAVVGLGDQVDLYPKQLSGGMQRRVALARAMVHEPDLLLLDEPFVSLDEPSTRELHELLSGLWQQRKPASLLVSHNLEEAITLADRLLFLGGSPASVVHEHRIEAQRPRVMGDPVVGGIRAGLLEKHPNLLAGSTEAGSKGSVTQPHGQSA